MSTIPPSAPGVYLITCTASGKIYVGSSINIQNRWQKHRGTLRDGKHHNPHIQSAYNKYGADAFVITVLDLCPIERLTEREQHYIDTLRPYVPSIGYNCGARAEHPMLGRKRPPEVIQKMRERKASPETRKRMSEAAKRQPPRSAESNRKTSEGNKGRKHTPESLRKITEASRGRVVPPRSEELRKKMGIAKMVSARRSAPRYIVTTPEGEEMLVNLNVFCDEHQLSRTRMIALLDGVHKSHKGLPASACYRIASPSPFQEVKKTPTADHLSESRHGWCRSP